MCLIARHPRGQDPINGGPGLHGSCQGIQFKQGYDNDRKPEGEVARRDHQGIEDGVRNCDSPRGRSGARSEFGPVARYTLAAT